MKSLGKWSWAVALGAIIAAPAIAQQEEETNGQEKREVVVVVENQDGEKSEGPQKEVRVQVVVDEDGVAHVQRDEESPAISKYYLGVVADPVEGPLKEHLGVDGLLITEVVDDSPAAKAGLQANDVLVKAGDTQLTDLQSLIKVIDEGKGESLRLEIIRKGQTKRIKATPVERSTLALEIETDEDGPARRELSQIFEFRPGMRVPIAGPPGLAWVGGANSLSITIQRENDKDAKITIRRDGETKEFEAKDLKNMKDLPADVSKHITMMLKDLGDKASASGNVVIQQLAPQMRMQMTAPRLPNTPQWTMQTPKGYFASPNADLAKKLEAIVEKLEKLEKRLDKMIDDDDEKDDDDQ